MTSSSSFLFFASVTLVILSLCRAQNEAASQGDAQAPPFLAEAGQEKVKEFYQFMSGMGHLKDTEITEKVKEWVGKQSEDIQKKYAEFEQEREKAKVEGEAAHDEAVKRFSEAAKKADKELTEISNNQNLSAKDKAEQINQKVQSLPKEVREEIGGGPMGGSQQQKK
uniref:Putative effector protein n=1 Tax=Heterodera avenae TaxID=34510 RepID=A0A2L0VDI0_HETAV|nr:putative effector protein [Heterodera avenae]